MHQIKNKIRIQQTPSSKPTMPKLTTSNQLFDEAEADPQEPEIDQDPPSRYAEADVNTSLKKSVFI